QRDERLGQLLVHRRPPRQLAVQHLPQAALDWRDRNRKRGGLAHDSDTLRVRLGRYGRTAMATDLSKVRAVGRSAMAGMRRTFAERMADLLSRDPDRLAAAVEMGIIRREWLEEPGSGQAVSAAPVEVVE